MRLTLAVFHPDMTPLKALESWNMYCMDVTLAVFQPTKLLLKAIVSTVAPANMEDMDVTLAVFQPETPLPAKAVVR